MKSRPRYSFLVLAAAMSWAVCAALMAAAAVISDGTMPSRSIVTSFPTAAAGVVLRAIGAP